MKFPKLLDLLKPRFVIGGIGLLVIGVLMVEGTITKETGISLITGILVAFGAYSARAPKDKK